MPIDFQLDEYMDLDLSTGDLSFVEDVNEVAQLMAQETLKNYDEDVYKPETGIKWFGFPSMYDVLQDDTYRELQIRKAYTDIEEVTSIPLLTLSRDDDGVVSIEFYANTIYNEPVIGNS